VGDVTDIRRFPPIWLRDNCGCDQCRDPHSGQKLFTINDIPADLAVASVVDDGANVTVLFDPDGHRSCFAWNWLNRYAADGPAVDPRTEDGKQLWTADTLDLAEVTGSWPLLLSSREERLWCLDAVLRLGFVLLREVPVTPGAVLDVAGEFGYVRETNYGRLFDVRVTPDATNLAFTARPIAPHTDNPYRDPVPTLQLLHCLVDGVDGGDSGLVDGFAVADQLRTRDPEAFAVLGRTPVTFRYRDESADLSATAPLIGLDAYGRIRSIRFNNRSTQALHGPYAETVEFYAAYRGFDRLLNAPEHCVTVHLTPGDCLVFDNTRILHARTGFTASGARHLQGCYADIDATESEARVLRARRDGIRG
jgi:gamma-butyrobetaine dioxygenase